MGYLYHNTRTIARFVARFCATVLHILKHLEGIVYQFVAFSAMDVYYHSHAASVVFIVLLIQSFVLVS